MGMSNYVRDREAEIDELISRSIPIPCKCTWETEKAKHRRQQLKEAICQMIEKALILSQTISDEDIGVRD